MNYEEARSNLDSLVSTEMGQTLQRNEATTRLQLIDYLFFDCLGWHRTDAKLEEPHGGEFADYTFMSAGQKLLIVEAKREGDLFELPVGSSRIDRALTPLIRDSPALRAAVEQAAGYCQDRGVPLAAVSDGHQVVAFVGARTDGVPPLDGRALVFSSLAFALDHFLELWQALSKPGVEARKLWALVSGSPVQELPRKLSATILNYPGLKNRNPFQADLQMLSEFVLEDIAGSKELESVFLQECYAQSGALSQYSLLSRQILQSRYSALFPEDEGLPKPAPATVPATDSKGVSPELVAASLSRRPILLLGDVGVGKTTFVRRLMRIDAAEQFADAITVSIDFGASATLTTDLKSFVLDAIERQLRDEFDIDVRENGFVRSVYRPELQRFRKGIFGALAKSNPTEFSRLELAELAAQLQKTDAHLKSSIGHLQKARRKQVVLFLDNADQRDYETQQQVFLIAQELAEQWPVTVFVALRPETFHRSVRSGALSGYHPKAFTISPPRTDVLIARRLNFAIRLIRGEFPLPDFPGRTTVIATSLSTLMSIFLKSIKNNREIVEFIDNTSGGNMRVALDMVKSFFGSGHVNTRKMLDYFERDGSYSVPVHEFVRAVIFGDTAHFDPSRSPVANLFDVSRPDAREHFILPLLVSAIQALSDSESGMGYVTITKVYDYLQKLGFQPDQIDQVIERAVSARLVEQSPGRFSENDASQMNALRATSAGAYLVARLGRMFTYVDAVIVDTPVFDRDVRSKISNVMTIEQRLDRADLFREYMDGCWDALQSSGDTFDWHAASAELKRQIKNIRERVEMRKEREQYDEELARTRAQTE